MTTDRDPQGGISRGGHPPESPDRAAAAAELRRAARDTTSSTAGAVVRSGLELELLPLAARQALPPSELVPVGLLSVSVRGPHVLLRVCGTTVRLDPGTACDLRRWLADALDALCEPDDPGLSPVDHWLLADGLFDAVEGT